MGERGDESGQWWRLRLDTLPSVLLFALLLLIGMVLLLRLLAGRSWEASLTFAGAFAAVRLVIDLAMLPTRRRR